MPTNLSAQAGLDWHVSRTCEGGQCIKVARDGEFVVIGNTNNIEGPVSEFTAEEWRQFVAGVKLGDFDSIV